MTGRPVIDVATPPGGWGTPWPNVAEIEAAFSHEKWTLVGGLMAQLHAIHSGIDAIRPTNDVDIVLHVETTRGVATAAASALEGLGYSLSPSFDPREEIAHRFTRGEAKVDLVASMTDAVDVLVADHHAPSVAEKLRGHEMVAIEGGTQALNRTINARLVISPERTTTVSVPGVFGAIVLKAAAYQVDSRDPDRHLRDAALLLCCLADPYADASILQAPTGSGCRRLSETCRTAPEPGRQFLPSSAATVRQHSAFWQRECCASGS